MMVKGKEINVVFPNIDKKCLEFSLYQLCPKNRKKVESISISSKSNGPAFPVLPGKSYQLVVHSDEGNIESGTFTVTEQGIKADKSSPPPAHPSILNV
jgi:hypothetical protein